MAHELPFSGNRAAEEAMIIERGARAPASVPNAKAKLFSIVATAFKWNKAQLDVCFWNGDAALRGKVATVADRLTQQLPIKFKWGGDCPGQASSSGAWESYPVRVALRQDSSLMGPGDKASSFFGLIGRQASYDHPVTVNLPFVGAPTDELLSSKVLHEFCHVLACLHEHQRAGCAEYFDKEAIKASFNLDEAAYKQNFELLPPGSLYGPATLGPLDNASIMLYEFKQTMFRSGTSPSCVRNTPVSSLSSFDEQGLRRLYTGSISPVGIPTISGVLNLNRELAKSSRRFLKGYESLLVDAPAGTPIVAGINSAIAGLQSRAIQAEEDATALAAADPRDVAAVDAALALLDRR